MDRLVEIPSEQLIDLRDRYKVEWPKYEAGYNTLNNYVKWLKQNPDLEDFHAYSLNGDLSDGTFVTIQTSLIYGDTLNNTKERLTKALTLLQLDPRKHYRYFYKPSIRTAVLEWVDRSKWTFGREWEFFMYCLSPEDGSKIILPDLPKGLISRPVRVEDIDEIVKDWSFNYPGSEKRLQCLVKYNVNVGVFGENGEPVGWSLRYEWGASAILHVNKPYRQQGIGKYLVKALSKQIANSGEYSYCTIVKGNSASVKLFESVGYKKNGFMHYIEVVPTPKIITNGHSK